MQFFLHKSKSTCMKQCTDNLWGDATQKLCVSCQGCLTCGTAIDKCVTCDLGLYLNVTSEKCVLECLYNFYGNA